MAYQIMETDECNECMDYVRMVSDSQLWKCVGCGINEGTLYLGKREGVFLWHRYELYCGHHCHERCYRRWCYKENSVGCPICGVLTKQDENQYCRYCDKWGHSRLKCPTLHLDSYEYKTKPTGG